LNDGVLSRLGSEKETRSDVRLVATTSEDPERWVQASPLMARLGAQQVTVPPLRRRLADLPGMCNRLLLRSAARHGRPARAFSREAMARLLSYPWPGNLAELAGAIERAVLLCDAEMIGTDLLQLELPSLPPSVETPAVTKSPIDLPAQLDELERRELSIALERCGGNKAEVARMLGIQRTTLYYRLKRLGIDV